ncbi:PREDICTED: epidermal growth factor-like protein 7 [Nanorana parkeri]|uniref:epidermal growth factor-like protein 7 n=1 Tax=Nanorana parkeri TaxID=125878 RepID=UPI000855095C|nr:PREDICTED: epidermal growth factor-like protein 7 [Nanorana parkeri]
MWAIGCLLTTSMIILGATGTDHFYRSGRRVCSSGAQAGVMSVTQSFVQPVYHPLITLCEGHRVCSTYRTTYKIAYRQVMKKTPLPLYTCCPGWKRMDSHMPGCNKVGCRVQINNGGTCIGYNKCKCSTGWRGDLCQTDVDECTMGSHQCAQTCMNTAGSFHCGCQEGFHLLEDGRSCDKLEKPAATQPPLLPPVVNVTGKSKSVKEDIQELRNKIEVLEQKLQLVLAPFHSPSTSSPEDILGPITLLTHSFQQLDRIDSLSEQISFLEERLETCSCKNEL